MKPPSALLFWLTASALADWLITRTLTRAAIFMPKSPLVIAVYQTVGLLGQIASTLAGLLAVAMLVWIVWRSLQTDRSPALALAGAGLVAANILFVFLVPTGWLAVAYHLLFFAAMAIVVAQLWGGALTLMEKAAGSLPALALLAAGLYQSGAVLYVALKWPGPPPLAIALFNLGELFAVLTPLALWWTHARRASRRVWLAGALPALLFTAAHFANPAMTGLFAIWSSGLTLYLPWPLYAVSLWLAAVTVLDSLVRGRAVGWTLLLLAAGGYAPQLSTQAYLGLIALWVFVGGSERLSGPLPNGRALRWQHPAAVG